MVRCGTLLLGSTAQPQNSRGSEGSQPALWQSLSTLTSQRAVSAACILLRWDSKYVALTVSISPFLSRLTTQKWMPWTTGTMGDLPPICQLPNQL